MSNEQLYDTAMDAITKLFSDQTVPVSKARENLEGLKEEINIMLDSLEES
jgi:hypothetical protein